MAALTEESLNKLSKTDLVALAVNLQDKMETMKSNLNEKVSNLTEEIQKLNALINCFGKTMLSECPVFKTGLS